LAFLFGLAAVPEVTAITRQLEVPQRAQYSTVPCRQAELTLALFQAVTVTRCFLVQTSHLCLYSIRYYRMMSRYASPQLGLQYFSFNPCVDPDCHLASVITPALKWIDHRCVPCGPVDARSDVIQTFFCAIVALHRTFHRIPRACCQPSSSHSARLYLPFHREQLYRRIRLVHDHWHSLPEVRLLTLFCRKLNGPQVQSTRFCFSARRRRLERRLLLL
jgi:hypothetical protein